MGFSHHTSLRRLVALAALSLLTPALLASTIATAQDAATTELDATAFGPAVNPQSGAELEAALDRVGLGDTWRESAGLGEATRQLLVEYAGSRSQTAAVDLAAVLTDIKRSETLQKVITGEVRKSTALLSTLTEIERRLERRITQDQASLDTNMELIQSVAIDMFSNAGSRSPEAIGINNSALLQTRRSDEITATVLETLIDQRDRLIVDLEALRTRLPGFRDSRISTTNSHNELVGVARDLPTRLAELEIEAEELLPSAADAFRSAEIADESGLSLRALDAYFNAEEWMDQNQPECGITWHTIAAVGLVESRHGTHGGNRLMPDGRTERQIVGAVLDGTTEDGFGNTVAVVTDTDGGVYDGDPLHDRAVGPMQFIPQTWRQWSVDADEDGRRDPNDMDDASVAAARLICANGQVRTTAAWDAAIFTYNQSRSYVAEVRDAYHHLDESVSAATPAAPGVSP